MGVLKVQAAVAASTELDTLAVVAAGVSLLDTPQMGTWFAIALMGRRVLGIHQEIRSEITQLKLR